jgi:hypothetical protein
LPYIRKGLAVAGLLLFGIGVATNLVGSIKCAFSEGPCGQGTGFLLFDAVAFVLAGVVSWSTGRPVDGALVGACGIVSALLMRSFWTTSGPWLFISAIPVLFATWRVMSPPPLAEIEKTERWTSEEE